MSIGQSKHFIASLCAFGENFHARTIIYTEGGGDSEMSISSPTLYDSKKFKFETSPYGIEWIRFEKECQVPDVVRNVPHIAFEVDDLDEALKGKEILLKPGVPSGGVRAAMILHNGAPVELIEFRNNPEEGSKNC